MRIRIEAGPEARSRTPRKDTPAPWMSHSLQTAEVLFVSNPKAQDKQHRSYGTVVCPYNYIGYNTYVHTYLQKSITNKYNSECTYIRSKHPLHIHLCYVRISICTYILTICIQVHSTWTYILDILDIHIYFYMYGHMYIHTNTCYTFTYAYTYTNACAYACACIHAYAYAYEYA